MKKYIADSYYEAFLKAQTDLGEDAMVVTSRTFSNSSWGGFYSKEMVEITAMAPKPRSGGKPPPKAPTRPMPSEELSRPGSGNAPTDGELSLRGAQAVSSDSAAKQSGPAKLLGFARNGRDSSAECFHHQNTHLENEDDPSHEERVHKLLETILNTKNIRQSNLGFGASPMPKPMQNSDLLSTKPFANLEKKISEIFSLLSEMQNASAQALSASPKFPPGLEHIQKKLTETELPPNILEDILKCLERDFPPEALNDPSLATQEFGRWLRKTFRFGCNHDECHDRGPNTCTYILIGPTGVGKTTTIAKLAASFALNVVDRKSVALLTTDTFRIGATEQLGRYSQIIEAEFEIILRPEDIPELLEKHQSKDIILVDTAGRCQKQHQEIQELQEFVSGFPNPTKFLVLSATTKYSDMVENVCRFGEVGIDHLIFTKVDETNSVGPLLGLLFETSASLAYVTHGQRVPDDFCRADAEFFLNRIFSGD